MVRVQFPKLHTKIFLKNVNKKQPHTLAPTGNSKSPINLTCLSWDRGKKPGHQKVTTADTGRGPKSKPTV